MILYYHNIKRYFIFTNTDKGVTTLNEFLKDSSSISLDVKNVLSNLKVKNIPKEDFRLSNDKKYANIKIDGKVKYNLEISLDCIAIYWQLYNTDKCVCCSFRIPSFVKNISHKDFISETYMLFIELLFSYSGLILDVRSIKEATDIAKINKQGCDFIDIAGVVESYIDIENMLSELFN